MKEQVEIFENKLGDISGKFDMSHLLDNFIEDLYTTDKDVLNDDIVNSAVYANTMMFTNMIAILLENKQSDAAKNICLNTHYFIILNSLMIDVKLLMKEGDIENSDRFFLYSDFVFEFLEKNMI